MNAAVSSAQIQRSAEAEGFVHKPEQIFVPISLRYMLVICGLKFLLACHRCSIHYESSGAE